jgi:hypothetical protein
MSGRGRVHEVGQSAWSGVLCGVTCAVALIVIVVIFGVFSWLVTVLPP